MTELTIDLDAVKRFFVRLWSSPATHRLVKAPSAVASNFVLMILWELLVGVLKFLKLVSIGALLIGAIALAGWAIYKSIGFIVDFASSTFGPENLLLVVVVVIFLGILALIGAVITGKIEIDWI